LRRAVERYIEDPLSEEILRGSIPPKSKVEALPDSKRENLVFHIVGEYVPEPVAVVEAATAAPAAPPAVRSGGGGHGGAGAARG
jgi:hypothetical protein